MSASVISALKDPDLVRDLLEHIAQYGTLGTSDAGLVDIGTGEYLSFVERELLDDLVFSGGATCRFFEGSYGAGKTHMLHLLEELGTRRGMVTLRTELSADLPLENWHAITRYLLENLVLSVNGQPARGLPAILGSLRSSGIADADALKHASLPHAGFRNAMVHGLAEDSLPMSLARYLSGQRVPARDLRLDGFAGIKDPLSQRNAELVLETVTGGLYKLGIRGTMLLFDETERSLTSSRSQAGTKVLVAANLMRRLIDACTTGRLIGTMIVFAVLPGFLENCTRVYQALGQRLEMMRGVDSDPAWRWPVLPIEAVSSMNGREEFLSGAVERFCQLVAQCGGKTGGLESRLLEEGHDVLEAQAGSGYRRTLVKRLAAVAIERIEED
jgi:hypothetical protein